MKKSHFKCSQCGECCKWSGYVRMTEAEIDAIAKFLKMDVNAFIEKYTRLTSDRRNLSLLENKDGSCIFLTSPPYQCAINQVKPEQCRNFPIKWNFPGWEKICKGGS